MDVTLELGTDGRVAIVRLDGGPVNVLTPDLLRAFTDALEQQKAKARASWAGSGDTATEAIWFPLREKVGASEFLGYDTEVAEGVVTALSVALVVYLLWIVLTRLRAATPPQRRALAPVLWSGVALMLERLLTSGLPGAPTASAR